MIEQHTDFRQPLQHLRAAQDAQQTECRHACREKRKQNNLALLKSSHNSRGVTKAYQHWRSSFTGCPITLWDHRYLRQDSGTVPLGARRYTARDISEQCGLWSDFPRTLKEHFSPLTGLWHSSSSCTMLHSKRHLRTVWTVVRFPKNTETSTSHLPPDSGTVPLAAQCQTGRDRTVWTTTTPTVPYFIRKFLTFDRTLAQFL